MGGQSGGGGSTPYEAPNTLNSAQSLRIIDAICEGEIKGFAGGNDKPWKSIYFDDTPVQNADGSFNFKGIVGFFQRGTPDQTYIPGFDASERAVPVSVEVKNRNQIVRAVTDELVNRLRVTVGVERNYRVADNGDTRPAETIMLVDLVGNNGIVSSKTVAFTEKSSGVYYQDVLFDKLPSVPFNIRVSRVSADSSTDREVNKTYFASYVEIIDAKLSYPHTALAALAMDSDQFGSNNPRRNYLIDGMLVNVPSNYDPVKRTYTGSVWDGSFKKAWTNNPAWVFYDVLTQPRYSTLARRLKTADIDKWTLYQVGKYCDELVDDGFGGKEPRFVCNAYITSRRQAGEFLLDLASVFRGLPVWDGNRFSLVMDADSDPVAMYNNSNVKDGLFAYSGVPLKSITTAVVVQYVDKFDGYRTKTEYVEDQQAVKRYGLNVKQITAFGCDSRGQAARYGAWVLETELRQQSAIKFTVGREGLRHLPYDVVQVMDNDYAGGEVSGRLKAVSGLTVTLDRDVEDSVGRTLSVQMADSLKNFKIMAQPAKNRLELSEAVNVEAGSAWVLMGRVKPRLYRIIGTKENAEEGTFEVTGILHDPTKYAAVDNRARFETNVTTLHGVELRLSLPEIKSDGDKLVISWDNLTADGSVLSYDIKIYRDNKLYRHIPDATTAEILLENLPNGQYRAEIRGRNARGVLSAPIEKGWTIDYAIRSLTTTARTNAIQLDWILPNTPPRNISTEVWYSKENNLQKAKKLAVVGYPQSTYTLVGASVVDTFYFWVRVIDSMGNTGEFSESVSGKSDDNPEPLLKLIQGNLGEDSFSAELWKLINSKGVSKADVEEQIGNITIAGKTLKGLGDSLSSLMTLTTKGKAKDGKEIITGIAQGIDGATGKSEFNIQADKFALADPNGTQLSQPFVIRLIDGRGKVGLSGDFISDGLILGKHIAANQEIQAPRINGGQLDIGGGNFTVSPQGSVVANNAVVRGRIEGSDGYFSGVVKASRIEGDVMKVYRLPRVSEGLWGARLPVGDLPYMVKFEVDVQMKMKYLRSTDDRGRAIYRLKNPPENIFKLMFNEEEQPLDIELPDEIEVQKEVVYQDGLRNRWVKIRSRGWLLGRWKDGFIRFGINVPEDYAIVNCVPFVQTAYLSDIDEEYKNLSGKMVWRDVNGGSLTRMSAIQKFEGRHDVVGAHRMARLYLPANIYGVEFEYRVEGNDDWASGVHWDGSTSFITAKEFNRYNHNETFKSFKSESGAVVMYSSILFSAAQNWQWIELRNVRVLVPESDTRRF